MDAMPAGQAAPLAALARFPAAAIEHARTRSSPTTAPASPTVCAASASARSAHSTSRALHRLILDTTLELTGSDRAAITEVPAAWCAWSPAWARTRRSSGTEVPAEVMREALGRDEPYVVDDVAAADPSQLLVRRARKIGAASFLGLAMRHQARVFGHLFAGAATPHRYRAETVEAMRILASMAAAVLEQRSAHADAERQAERLAATIEHLPMFIEVFDAERRAGARQRGGAPGPADLRARRPDGAQSLRQRRLRHAARRHAAFDRGAAAGAGAARRPPRRAPRSCCGATASGWRR